MGVDLNEIARRRENRKKDDEVLAPNGSDTNPKHDVREVLESRREEQIDKIMPNSKQADGSINIDGAMHDLEKLMRGADKGKFLGMGKDGELDGNEMRAYLKNLEAKGFGIPDSARGIFDALTRDPDFKIDIEEIVSQGREGMTRFDKNHDGIVSTREMQAAVKEINTSNQTKNTRKAPVGQDIGGILQNIEGVLRDSDNGKGLSAIGKNGTLKGKELDTAIERLGNMSGPVAYELKSILQSAREDGGKVNIDSAIANLSYGLNQADTNRDRAVSPKEMQALMSRELNR